MFDDDIVNGDVFPCLSFDALQIDNKILRRKIKGYEQLFGVEPEVFVFGAWSTAIGEPEGSTIESYSTDPATIVWVGNEWIRLKTSDRLVDVRLREESPYGGAHTIMMVAKNG